MRHPFSPRSPVLGGLSPQEMTALVALGSIHTFAAGSKLYEQGDVPQSAFRILDGRVNLFTESTAGGRLIVRAAFPGDVLGIGGIFRERPYLSTAHVVTPCRVHVIPQHAFLAWMSYTPAVSAAVSLALANEYLDMVELARIIHLAGGTAARVLSVLLTMANEDDLGKPFLLRFSHGELADMAACARESVSRTLLEFERNGTIRVCGSTITVLQSEVLLNLCCSLKPHATPEPAAIAAASPPPETPEQNRPIEAADTRISPSEAAPALPQDRPNGAANAAAKPNPLHHDFLRPKRPAERTPAVQPPSR